MAKCKYKLAWTHCENEADETGLCATHKNIPCCVCGKPSTGQCMHTGQFVCGAPLCDDCIGTGGDSTKGLGWGFIGHRHVSRESLEVKDGDGQK